MEDKLMQFLANGGQIKHYESKPYDPASKYKKDLQLKALRALKKTISNPSDLIEIERAISRRIEVLRASY